LVVCLTSPAFSAIEQRMSTTFYFKLSKTPTENYEILQIVYVDEAKSRCSVSEWFKRFKDLLKNLQDDPNAGVLQVLEMQTQS
jgi:hypothetical protein